jgi:hypothetical protein
LNRFTGRWRPGGRVSNPSATEPRHDFRAAPLRRTSRMSNERHKQPTSFLTGDFHECVEHSFKDRCSFLHYLGLLASSGRVFGVRAWSVIEFVHGARTAIPRRMEPPVLLDRLRDVESIKIHYLVPGRDKVVNKLLLRIGTGVDFGQRAELRV